MREDASFKTMGFASLHPSNKMAAATCGSIQAQQGGVMMSTKASIDDLILRVAEIIIQELKLEDVTPEKFDPEIDLVDEVGVDSMDLATVALVLQDEFGIRIDEDDYPKLTNIRLIAENIMQKLNDRSEIKAA
jgi:acyl carrier protein